MTLEDIAIRKASQSRCRYKVSAIGINRKGEVIGTAVNKPRFNRWHGGMHAEIALIKRYGNRLRTIIICRVNGKGKICPIKPCMNCKKVSEKMDIKIVSIKEII